MLRANALGTLRAIAMAATTLAAAGCGASGAACGDCIEGCIDPKVRASIDAGWRARPGQDTVRLAQGEVHDFMLSPLPGNTYRLLACGDDGFEDVDLLVYRGAELVARDDTADREPVVQWAPRVPGAVTVRVYAARRSAAGPGSVAFATMVR